MLARDDAAPRARVFHAPVPSCAVQKHKQSLQLEYDALMQTYDAIRDRLH